MAGWCGCHMISWLAGFVVTLQLASWFFYHMCRRPASWIHMCKLSTGFDVTCADGQLDLMSHEEMVSWFFVTCWDGQLVFVPHVEIATWFCCQMSRWPTGFVVTCADGQLVLLSHVQIANWFCCPRWRGPSAWLSWWPLDFGLRAGC